MGHKGSIIERQRKGGAISYQAMVKISGAKAAVRTFPDREQAQGFLDSVQAERAKTVKAKEYRERWFTPLSPGALADRNQELWANEWLKTTLTLYSKSDRIADRFRQPIRTVIKFGGDVKLGEIDRKWVRNYLKFARTQKTRTKTIYKWATIVNHMRIISAAMNWRAEEMEAQGVKFPFNFKMIPADWEVKRERRLAPGEERQIILELRKSHAKPAKHWVRMFRLAVNTAARLQELVLAEWSEFNLKGRYWTIPARHTKSGKSRSVPLNNEALRALRVMKLVRSQESDRIFHLIKNPKAAACFFSKLTRTMRIKDLRFHDLRHEAVSRIVLKQRLLSPVEILGIVGHSSIGMLQRYSNLRGDELAAKLIN